MSGFTDKTDFIEKNGYYVSTPHGKSMLPFIKGERDIAVLRPATGAPKKYDAILYENANGEHVLHRIVGKDGKGYRVRGDNCYYTERVAPDRIIGVLAELYRDGGGTDLLKSKGRRFRVRVWVWLYPLRKIINYAGRALRKLRRTLKKTK